MLKAIKIRLYLNNNQKLDVNSILGSYRFVYNKCLEYKKLNYDTNKLNTSLSDLSHYFHQDLRTEFDWLKLHNTKVLKQSIINLETAYKNFFKQHTGFPKFKSKHDNQKVRFPLEAISKNTFNEKESRLNLTKSIKGLKFECSDRDKQYLYKNKKHIKSVTISKSKTNKYYASILIDGDLLKEVKRPDNYSVGIDLGIKTLLTLSNGETIENPKWIRSNEIKLKRLQKQLSKKVKGSNNRKKSKLKLATLHEKIKNKKEDYIHNITTKIINENQVIILEDLNVKGMMKNHKLAKSIQELGLYEMRRQLEYKAKWNNRELIFISRWFPSSKKCNCCGNIKSNLKLSDREYICEECGLVIDRDLNAAINIENEGKRIVGIRSPELAFVDYPTMDDRLGDKVLKSSDRKKQKENNIDKISILL